MAALHGRREEASSRGGPGGGRVIDYLRVSITDRCNFRCVYCMPAEGVRFKDHSRILTYEEIVRFTWAAADLGITRVRVTGGEPLARKQSQDLVAMLAAVPGVKDLALTTNGYLLEEYAAALRAAGLSRINISIDSLDPDRFSRITRGARLEKVLAGLERALEVGFSPVKVNVVMLDGIEDDLDEFVAVCMEMPVHVRFIEFMPVGRRRGGIWKFVPRQRVLDALGRYGELSPAHSPQGGGPARYFRFQGARGTIGFISSMSDHFCSECNRLRLTADGKLRNCLFSDNEIDVVPYINGDMEELQQVILRSINGKRFDRLGEESGGRTMAQIGG
ncbi:MAG: GTP 3',8-cyclase MoaA [Thermoleophilia bacterium]|nr:GTP 3',8-cyclase MoaA [Thermoleophilia bacterium]